ncbi:hypothetical protein [Nodosilinea sp. E11]|nr:hypothetical protein [Nodosilinea sp. E11]WOD37014.1 hypothetical protein RRF56_00700 [Nodosilinea sp. E11]
MRWGLGDRREEKPWGTSAYGGWRSLWLKPLGFPNRKYNALTCSSRDGA